MDRTFSQTLSTLRRERNINQRTAAAELGISQALLSHYENGTREPGLAFVCRVCDYYKVSADYLLCRTDRPNGAASTAAMAKSWIDQLQGLVDRAQMALDEFSDTGDLNGEKK